MPNHRRNGRKPRRGVRQAVGGDARRDGHARRRRGASAGAAPQGRAGPPRPTAAGRAFNDPYTGEHLRHVAFPLGGIGAGMVCLEGTGALSHVSLRHRPDVHNEPCCLRGGVRGEGHRQRRPRARRPGAAPWKLYESPPGGQRRRAPDVGPAALPRRRASRRASRSAPCALKDDKLPSRSSSPAGARSSRATPTTRACPWPRSSTPSQPHAPAALEAVFSFHARTSWPWAQSTAAAFVHARRVRARRRPAFGDAPRTRARSRAVVDDPAVRVDARLVPRRMVGPADAWHGRTVERGTGRGPAAGHRGRSVAGGSLFVPFSLAPAPSARSLCSWRGTWAEAR